LVENREIFIPDQPTCILAPRPCSRSYATMFYTHKTGYRVHGEEIMTTV